LKFQVQRDSIVIEAMEEQFSLAEESYSATGVGGEVDSWVVEGLLKRCLRMDQQAFTGQEEM
jgi:hypothetical protein